MEGISQTPTDPLLPHIREHSEGTQVDPHTSMSAGR